MDSKYLAQLEELFVEEAGIAHYNWEKLYEWLDQSGFEAAPGDSTWDAILDKWLTKTKESLGDNYLVFASENFILLSGESEKNSQLLISSAEKSLQTINENLSDLRGEEKWKIILFCFSSIDHFLDYASFYRRDVPVSASSTGIFLSSAGYQHIILRPNDLYDMQRTIAHELTHYILEPFDPPVWLDEGLATAVENFVFGEKSYMTPENFKRLQLLWKENNLESFWNGSIFSDISMDHHLLYQLADILARDLLKNKDVNYLEFFEDIEFEDNAFRAIAKHFDFDIKEAVSRFLSETI